MTTYERTRGVTVYPMDEEVGGPSVLGNYALCVRVNEDISEVRMVHTEGVAYLVTPDKPWCWTDYQPDQKKWSPRELMDAAMKSETKPVDLADWVRMHNDRLESNFHQIYRWATKE